jgi:RNA polymerase primary sigma factor
VELAKDTQLTEDKVRDLLELVDDPVSLDTPVGDGDSLYGDMIEDVHSERPEAETARNLRHRELAHALATLNPRMRHVLALRFGLDGGQPQTLEQVGGQMGVTRERVRQLESRALRELRLAAPDLELYLRPE